MKQKTKKETAFEIYKIRYKWRTVAWYIDLLLLFWMALNSYWQGFWVFIFLILLDSYVAGKETEKLEKIIFGEELYTPR